MKFTKEEAFENLKGILTNNGKKTLRMSEKSIKSQIETLMPLIANEEMELADFVEKVKPSFETMNSNMEKDNADFVNAWNKNHPESKQEPTKKGEEGKGDEEDEWKQRFLQLEKKFNDSEKANVLNGKRKEIKAKLKEKGINDADWTSMMLDEVSIQEDTDVDAKVESLLKIYNKQKANVPLNVTPLSSSGGNDPNKDPFADIRESRKQENEAKGKIV